MKNSEMLAYSNQSNSSVAEDDHSYYLKLIGQGIIVPVICVIGMILNLLTIIVLRNKQLKQSSYTYLTSLAVADFLSLLLFGANGIGQGHFPKSYYWSIYEGYVYFSLALITTNASVFMIVSVTVERFIFLYQPLKAKFWCTQKSARKIVLVLWVISVIMNIPRFFVLKISSEGTLIYTTFGDSYYYSVLSWFYFIIFSLGCGIVLIVFNILLIRGIHVANEKRKLLQTGKHTADRGEEVRLTRTLISVIFLYLIGELPSCIFSRMVFSSILGNKNHDVMNELWYKICLCIATIFVVLQHSLNFVFYCVFNKRFYQILKDNFQGFMCKKEVVEEYELSETTKENILLNNGADV